MEQGILYLYQNVGHQIPEAVCSVSPIFNSHQQHTTYKFRFQVGAALKYQLPQLSFLIFTPVTPVRIEQLRQLL